MLWRVRVLWTGLPVASEERSSFPWSSSTSCRCCRTVSRCILYEQKSLFIYLFFYKCIMLTVLFSCSWLEVQARWSDGAVCYRRGLSPTDGGHSEWDRQLRFALLSGSCKRTLLWPINHTTSFEIEQASTDAKRLIPNPSAPQGSLRCLQRYWTDGHRLRPHLPEEIPRQGIALFC